MNRAVSVTLVIAGFFVVWELGVRISGVPNYILPSPSEIAIELASDPLWYARHAAYTVGSCMLGFFLALALGILAAIGIVYSRVLENTLYTLLVSLNSIPKIALAPLFIIWFGIGIWSKVVVVFLGAVIPILINTQAGVKTSEARFIRVARSFSASKIKIFSSIILPGTVPFIFTGLKYGAGRALLGVVVGELYASTAGLGHMIAEAGNTFQTDVVFFGVLIFMVTGLVVVAFLDVFERRFEKWRPDLH